MSLFGEVHASTVANKPNLRSLTITELPTGIVGQKLKIQLHALNSAGLFSQSNILEVIVAGVPSTPTSAPTEDTTTTTYSSIGVNYLEPDNQGSSILTYDVQIDDGIGGPFSTFAGGQTTYLSLSAVDTTGITKGETYRVRYRAKNINGWSDYSNIAYVLAASPPDAPPVGPVYITSTDTSITLQITFSIENNGAPITLHSLYMDSGSLTSSFTKILGYDGLASTYEVTGLTKGTSYRFYSSASNIKGESNPSQETRYTAGSPPVTPSSLVLTSSTTTSITLIWTADTTSSLPVTGYAIEINDGSQSPAGRSLASQAITGVWSEVYNGRGRKDLTSVTISELSPGTQYNFRYRSFDANGASSYSPVFTFYSCVNPSAPGVPTASNTNLTQINVSWTAPADNGGCDITGYKLYRDDGAGGAVDVQVAIATLTGHPEITQVAVTDLPSSPTGLSFVFKVVAYTSFATSGVSSGLSSSFLFALPPSAPTVAPTNGTSTSASQVQIDITAVTVTNGASILSYDVQIDDGLGGSFIEVSGLTSYDLTTSRIVTSRIITGRLYRTRYRAYNIKGYSSYSPVGYIEASQVPNQPSSPSVTLVGTNAIISWTLPYNGGNLIKFSEVFIQSSSGTFVKDTTAQVSNSITESLTTIIATYSLSQGDSIVAQVRTWNSNGFSAFSPSSTNNPVVFVAPLKPPSAPVRVYSELQPTDANYGTTLTISVPELTGTNTGGSPIISYQVEYDQSGSGNWIVLGGLSPDSLVTMYTVTALTNGNSYYVRYRARNIQDWGPYSDSSYLLVAEVPVKISPAATTANSGNQVTVGWTKPGNGGSTITSYTVFFRTKTGADTTLST